MSFKSIEELNTITFDSLIKLDDVKEYLNPKGLARLEALKAIYYHSRVSDDLKDLYEWEDFQNLLKVPNMDPEYYRVLRICNNRLKEALE